MSGGLTAFKRRVQVGTRLLCVENQHRPEMNGTERTVTKVQGNAIAATFHMPTGDITGWTYWPKASEVSAVTEDEVTFDMGRGALLTLRVLS